MIASVRTGKGAHRWLGGLVYGGMTLIACIVPWAREASLVRVPASVPAVDGVLPSLALGLVLAAVTIVSTRVLVTRVAWIRTLREDLRAMLANATLGDAAWLAIASGIGEELLFRGALLPWWGLWASSLTFGVLHVGPARRFLPWTLWATAMGVLFGWIYEATGHLEGCILAHVLVNWVNLRFVVAFDGRLDAPARDVVEQSLVARRVRRD